MPFKKDIIFPIVALATPACATASADMFSDPKHSAGYISYTNFSGQLILSNGWGVIP